MVADVVREVGGEVRPVGRVVVDEDAGFVAVGAGHYVYIGCVAWLGEVKLVMEEVHAVSCCAARLQVLAVISDAQEK